VQRRETVVADLHEHPGKVFVAFEGKRVGFPDYVRPALERLLGGDGCRVRDLPGLDAAGRLVLVRRLVREGFATVDA
jgi:hypothetical protein